VWIWVKKTQSKRKPLKLIFVYFLFFVTFLFVLSNAVIRNKHIYRPNDISLIPVFQGLVDNYRVGGVHAFIQAGNRARFLYSSQGFRLTKLSPLVGWGPGGFIRNVNDIRYQKGEKPILLHNTTNQYLQMSSEFGLLGTALNFALHFIPLWMIFRIRTRIEDPKERMAVGICFSTITVWLFLYLTGPHIMAVDVLWPLNVYLAFLFTTALKHGYSFENIKLKSYVLVLALLTVLFVFGTYEATFGRNGYAAKLKSEWWPNPQYGYYSWEDWNGKKVRWTTGESFIRIAPTGHLMSFDVYATPHNIGPKGLNFKVFINKKLWDEINFTKGEMRNLRYYIPFKKSELIEITTVVDRTFIPIRLGLNKGTRQLGVGISEIKFYDEMPQEGMGFWGLETWTGGPITGWPQNTQTKFRWTGLRASMNIKDRFKNGVTLFLLSSHPDVANNPVRVEILSDGRRIEEIVFTENQWKKIYINPNTLGISNVLTFQVSRTWNPKLLGLSEDCRDLGVAVAVLGDL
jgi:hypothetical protein